MTKDAVKQWARVYNTRLSNAENAEIVYSALHGMHPNDAIVIMTEMLRANFVAADGGSVEAAFVVLLENLLHNIDALDRKTVWMPKEPKWWLQMKALEREALRIKNERT